MATISAQSECCIVREYSSSELDIISLLTVDSGHYDLIYLPQDLPPSSMPAVVPTYLQYASQPYQDPVSDLGMHDLMSAIPGMSYANPHSGWMSSSSYADSDFFAMTTPVQQCAPPLPTPSVPAPVPIAQPQMQPAPVFISAAPAHLVPPPTQMPEELVIRTVPHSATSSHLNFQNPTSSGPFRPSHWEFESEFAQHVPLQTAIFKKWVMCSQAIIVLIY